MHDPADISRRIDRRDDYGQLLARDQVIQDLDDLEDVDAWRDDIRRQARADQGPTGSNVGIVWALRVRRDESAWQAEVRR